ncbi:MAG: hypothetical protein U1E05_10715 [Patescibacteria group bacterium]|nr:hypothetical protein [Patescibacteria group bacterium]
MTQLNLMPKTTQWLAFGFSILVGALVWIASPFITGHREPWDSLSVYYGGSLLIGGFVAGLFVPRRFWLWAVGIWLGQMIGFAWCMGMSPRSGPLWPFGFFVFLPAFSLWGLLGACLGAGVGKLRAEGTAQPCGQESSFDSGLLRKADAIKWRFAIVVLFAIPVVIHTLCRGAYKVPPDGTFWIGPISTTMPYVFLALLFLAHCFALKSRSRRSAYCGAIMAWISMMAFTVFIVSHTPGRMTSTMGLAMAFTPVCYIPFLVVPYIIGAIGGRLWTKWKDRQLPQRSMWEESTQ